MTWIREDEFIGHRIAERLGLQVDRILGAHGADGHVYALTDGRAMKVSFIENEAAACLAIMELPEEVRACLPRIDAVMWEDDEGGALFRTFIILREEVPDVPAPCAAWRWRDLTDRFSSASCRDNQDAIQAAIAAAHEECIEAGNVLREMQRLIRHVREESGLFITDATDGNFGLLPSGALTMRDLGAVDGIPDWAIEAVVRRDLPKVPPATSLALTR